MRFWIISILMILSVSCIKHEDPTEGVLVVQGVLRTNSVTQSIRIQEIKDLGQGNVPVSNALVTISDGLESIQLSETEDGFYEYVGLDFEVLAGKTYYLTVSVEDKVLSSETTIPENVEIVSQSETSFTVELDSNGEIVFATEWENNPKYSQVVDLFSIEASPTEIPFENEIEDFDDLYEFPIPNSSLILKDLNFRYYGQYVLTINLMNREYEDFFFYDTQVSQTDIPEAPDNIEGGEGYFTGVSREQILLEILEN